jgi:hypothetical protein
VSDYQSRTRAGGSSVWSEWQDVDRMSSAMQDVMNTLRNGSPTQQLTILTEAGAEVQIRHTPRPYSCEICGAKGENYESTLHTEEDCFK